jgi:hypothetical protein
LLIACDVLRDISWDFQIFQILHFQWNTRRACLSATSTFLFQSSSDGNSSQQSREPSNNSNNLSTSMFWYFGAERASEARAVKGQQTAWTVKDLWCSFVGALCGPKKNQRPFFSKSQLGAKRRERELAGKQCWNSTLACAPCMMWAGDVLATSTGKCAKLNFTQTGWTGPYVCLETSLHLCGCFGCSRKVGTCEEYRKGIRCIDYGSPWPSDPRLVPEALGPWGRGGRGKCFSSSPANILAKARATPASWC